jgi:hypothetical protein
MSNMLDILRNFDAVEKSVAECPPEADGQMGQQPSINIALNDTQEMSQLLQALQMVQNAESQEEEVEEYDNEPEEEYMDLDDVLPSGDDLHRKKTMYPPASQGDNPMAMESIKERLWQALSEKKHNKRPDSPDLDDDGDTEEPIAQAAKDAKKKKTTEGRGRGKLMAGRGRGKNVKAAEGRGRGKARGRGKG